MVNAFDLSDFHGEERTADLMSPRQRYIAAWDSASALGYSYLRLTEAGNPGAFDAFVDWCAARDVKPTLLAIDNESGSYEWLAAKVGVVEMEVIRRVR